MLTKNIFYVNEKLFLKKKFYFIKIIFKNYFFINTKNIFVKLFLKKVVDDKNFIVAMKKFIDMYVYVIQFFTQMKVLSWQRQ